MFIELDPVIVSDHPSDSILVNVSHIVSVTGYTYDHDFSIVELITDRTIVVRENYGNLQAKILKLLKLLNKEA